MMAGNWRCSASNYTSRTMHQVGAGRLHQGENVRPGSHLGRAVDPYDRTCLRSGGRFPSVGFYRERLQGLAGEFNMNGRHAEAIQGRPRAQA